MDVFEVPDLYKRDGYHSFISRYHVDEGDDRNLQANSGGGYEPIRIVFDTRPILALRSNRPEINERIDGHFEQMPCAAAAQWSRHLSVRPVQSDIVIKRDTCGSEYRNVLDEDMAFSDADLVILVGGDIRGVCGDRTLAYAGPCALSEETDRPVVGTMDFCLESGDRSLEREIRGKKLSEYYGPGLRHLSRRTF